MASINPYQQELVWQATRATGVVTNVVNGMALRDYLWQIIDAGAGTWTIEIQANQTDDLATDANWKAVAFVFGTSTTSFTAAGVCLPIAPGVTLPQIRAKLTAFTSGTPRVFMSARPLLS